MKNKKIKIFISQPMNGLTNEQIKFNRSELVAEYLKKEGLKEYDVEIIDSFFENAPHYVKPVWFLGKSLEKMSEADIVLFADGWDEARGCIIEHSVAEAYGIEIREQDFFSQLGEHPEL